MKKIKNICISVLLICVMVFLSACNGIPQRTYTMLFGSRGFVTWIYQQTVLTAFYTDISSADNGDIVRKNNTGMIVKLPENYCLSIKSDGYSVVFLLPESLLDEDFQSLGEKLSENRVIRMYCDGYKFYSRAVVLKNETEYKVFDFAYKETKTFNSEEALYGEYKAFINIEWTDVNF